MLYMHSVCWFILHKDGARLLLRHSEQGLSQTLSHSVHQQHWTMAHLPATHLSVTVGLYCNPENMTVPLTQVMAVDTLDLQSWDVSSVKSAAKLQSACTATTQGGKTAAAVMA